MGKHRELDPMEKAEAGQIAKKSLCRIPHAAADAYESSALWGIEEFDQLEKDLERYGFKIVKPLIDS